MEDNILAPPNFELMHQYLGKGSLVFYSWLCPGNVSNRTGGRVRNSKVKLKNRVDLSINWLFNLESSQSHVAIPTKAPSRANIADFSDSSLTEPCLGPSEPTSWLEPSRSCSNRTELEPILARVLQGTWPTCEVRLHTKLHDLIHVVFHPYSEMN